MNDLDSFEQALAPLGAGAREAVRAAWQDASRTLSPTGLGRYVDGLRELAALGVGSSLVLAHVRETPAVAREIGEAGAFDLIDAALAVYAHTDARTAEQVLATGALAARRIKDAGVFAAYLDFLRELAELAPAGVIAILDRLGPLLDELGFDAMRRWALLGVQSHTGDPSAVARYFRLDNREAHSLLESETAATLLSDVQRRLSFYARALWGREIRLRPALEGADAGDLRAARRATLDGATVRLPTAYRGFGGETGVALYRAAVAHSAAHVVFTTVRFPLGSLKPLQVALVSLIEDARVEQLAIREFPGLKRLWRSFHVAQRSGVVTSASLMSRLARALIDEEFCDDNPWVVKGRRLFFEQEGYWDDQAISRSIGGALGNDMGQMRIQFNFKTYVVEPAYRDDNQGIWDFGEQGGPGADDALLQGARLADDSRPQDHEQEREDGDAGEPERVRLVAPGKRERDEREEPLSPPLRYAEWDYIIGRERPAWCTLLEKPVAEGDPQRIDVLLQRYDDLVDRINRLVQSAQVHRPVRLSKRLDGDRLDLDGCIRAAVDLRAGITPDPRVHAMLGRQRRDISVLVLLDLSESANDKVARTGTTVLELARDATLLLAQAMQRIGDSFAIHGFASNGRHDVGYYRFKDFDRPYRERAKARLAGMSAQLSTRMGTALRHAGTFLRDRRAHTKLVLVVTDGEPSDIDVHDADYLVFDAKKAVEANHRHGILTYCISVDPAADRYVSRIFGPRNYTVLDHIRNLPAKLPMLYMRLTR